MKICEECQSEMIKVKGTIKLKTNNEIKKIENVKIYKCKKCSNEIIDNEEFERIENILKNNMHI